MRSHHRSASSSSRGKRARLRCNTPHALLASTVAVQVILAALWSCFRSLPKELPQASVAAPMIRAKTTRTTTIAVKIRVDQFVLHKLRPSPCVSLDWWPATKCDNGDCAWANSSILTVDWSDPLLLASVQALGPLTLRAGGSLADLVEYTGPWAGSAVSCDGREFVRDDTMRVGFRGGCLPWARWLALLDFCTRASCHIFFSVNALRGRQRADCASGTLCRRLKSTERPPCCSNYTGAWDEANLAAFRIRSGAPTRVALHCVLLPHPHARSANPRFEPRREQSMPRRRRATVWPASRMATSSSRPRASPLTSHLRTLLPTCAASGRSCARCGRSHHARRYSSHPI